MRRPRRFPRRRNRARSSDGTQGQVDRTAAAVDLVTGDHRDRTDNPVIALAQMTMTARGQGKPSDSGTSLHPVAPIGPAIKSSLPHPADPMNPVVMARGVNWPTPISLKNPARRQMNLSPNKSKSGRLPLPKRDQPISRTGNSRKKRNKFPSNPANFSTNCCARF